MENIIQTPVVIPQPPKRSLLPIMLAVVSLALLGSTAFLGYQNMQLQKQIIELSKPTPSATPAPQFISPTTVVVNPLKDWQIYTNTIYSYSVQYPPAWRTNIGDNGATTNFFATPTDPEFISITVHDNPNSTEIHTWLIDKSIMPDPNNIATHIQEEDVIVAGITSVKVTTPVQGGQTSIYIPKGNKVYSLYNNANANIHSTQAAYDKNMTILNQMLSTFTFSNQPTTTCRPRPPCLDTTPRCLMPETADMCPPKQAGVK